MYAIIQSGYAIMGTGITIEKCVADANEWIDELVIFVEHSQDGLIDNTHGRRYQVNDGALFITDDAITIAEYGE